MGNSRWRLETTLNYIGKRVHELGRQQEVEVLVADWGSEIPLRNVLELSPAAARIVSFILVPPDIARALQKDSPFPEVLALNAAARRAKGEYIGRIDQDTLVGGRFLQTFFDLHEGRQQLDVPLNSALLFANLRMVPYRFAVRCPSGSAVERFTRWFGLRLKVDLSHRRRFYAFGVGIWLLHRHLWNECGSYDERLIYMNEMENDMIARLMQRYRIVNLGKLVDCDFYHLEHYHPMVPRNSSTYRKVNQPANEEPTSFHPNNTDWGLVGYPLETVCYLFSGRSSITTRRARVTAEFPLFLFLLLLVGLQVLWDSVILSFRDVWKTLFGFYIRWKLRASVSREALSGHPINVWPRLLIKLWRGRKSAHTSAQNASLLKI